jgi:predicted PurR-regulated permease PerM
MQPPLHDRTVVRFEIAPSTIAWILATVAGVWLVTQLWVIALLLVVALIFAGTLNPLVEWLERRGLKRTFSLLLLVLGSLIVSALIVFLTVPQLVQQLAQLVRSAPEGRLQLIALLERHTFTLPLAHAARAAGLDELIARAESYVLGHSPGAVVVAGYVATTIVLSFYFLADGKRTQGALYAVVPRGYHMRLARILHNLETIVGGYMRGQLLTSVAMGVFTYLLLIICGVSNALSLALFAALTDVIPFVGGLLAALPAILSAFPRGLPVVLTVAVSLFLYMELENRVLVPKVYGHALRLSPATVILALIAGGILLGVVGALLALPIVAGLQMILVELRVELPGDDSDDRSASARNAKTEATYERMSAGATAPEAGSIARDLAHELRDADADAVGAARQAQAFRKGAAP